MKFIARLPEEKFYIFTRKTDDWYIFHDMNTPMVKIYSPSERIRGEWCILLSMQYGKSDNTKYPYSMSLKLFPVDKKNQQEKQANIIRTFTKGKFSYSMEQTLFFATFPVNLSCQQVVCWVGYSFI